MSRYIISDHHFGHSRIIGYTNRPFSSVGEMNQTMLNRHYEVVQDTDILIHLGDIAMDMQDGEETIEYFERLDGDILLRGNHDVGLDSETAPFPVLDACILEHGGREFHCTHRPEDIPNDWDRWAIHDHMHNNDTSTYPFIASDAQRVNISSELLNYRPIALDTLTEILDACPDGSHIRDVDVAQTKFG